MDTHPALVLDARGSSPASRIRRSLFRLLDGLDSQRPSGVVRVRAEGREVGRLVVVEGRLCMAMPTGPSGAGGPAPAASHELTSLAAEAFAAGRTLAGAVLQSGRADALRDALLEETAHGLARIVDALGDRIPILEIASTRADYEPSLTLGTAEVFIAALRQRVVEELDTSALDTLPDAEVALLLHAGEPGELAYPVAHRGLAREGVRHVVTLIRLATALSLGLTPEVDPVDGAGVWNCVALGRELLLARTPHSADDLQRRAGPTIAAPPPPALPEAPAPGHGPLAPRVDDIPSGLIWPPLEGRDLVREATTDSPEVEILADGSWLETHGTWQLHSAADDVFPTIEAARTALLDWARWCAGLKGRISSPRCLFAARAHDGSWRLWQGLAIQPSLAARIDRPATSQAEIARVVLEAGRALAEAETVLRPFGLPCLLETVGTSGGKVVHVGLVPRPGATTRPGEARPVSAVLPS